MFVRAPWWSDDFGNGAEEEAPEGRAMGDDIVVQFGRIIDGNNIYDRGEHPWQHSRRAAKFLPGLEQVPVLIDHDENHVVGHVGWLFALERLSDRALVEETWQCARATATDPPAGSSAAHL